MLRTLMPAAVDDAFITFRYAWNLANGNGLVFNPGERIFGTTTPLYALLQSGVISAGLEPWRVALGLDVLFFAALCGMIAWLGRLGAGTTWAVLAIGGLFLEAFLTLPVGGMESGLFIALTYGALAATSARRPAAAFGLAMLAVLTRPEGVVALAVVAGFLLRNPARPEGRRAWWALVLCAVIPLAIAGGALTAWFGSAVPQTIRAKQALAALKPDTTLPLFAPGFLKVAWYGPYGVRPWGVFEWIGFAAMLVRVRALRPVAVWLAGYVAFMALGGAPNFHWYFTPPWPARMMAMALGLLVAARFCLAGMDLLGVRPGPAAGRILRPLIALLLLAILSPLYVEYAFEMPWRFAWRNAQALDCKRYEEAGPWLRAHAPSGSEVAALEIGYLAYFSRLPVFDMMGLASPIPTDGSFGKRSLWEQALARRSPFVVHPFARGAFHPVPREFAEWYEPVKSWRTDRHWTVVFRRRKAAVPPPAGPAIGMEPRGFQLAWTGPVAPSNALATPAAAAR